LHNWSLQCKRSQMNVNKAMWHFVNMPPQTSEYWHLIFVTHASQRQMWFYT
jgi:hypothetical protein